MMIILLNYELIMIKITFSLILLSHCGYHSQFHQTLK